MRRRLERSAVVVGLAVTMVGVSLGCGGDGGSPTTPTPTTTSVSVAFPAGGTIFIGSRVQFEARETLSGGTTRVATNATWGSDAPAVATVSPTGLVTAVAAGEATIFADVNPRGTLRIRVFPNFGGTWSGSEVATSCEESGAFAGFCGAVSLVGEVGAHRSTFTQSQASVNAVIDEGDGTTATMTGTITIGGGLELPTAPVLPADPKINLQLQNWRSRADIPSQMTGTYELLFTVPGVTGFVRLGVRLQDVVKTSAPAALVLGPDGSTLVERVLRRIENHGRGF